MPTSQSLRLRHLHTVYAPSPPCFPKRTIPSPKSASEQNPHKKEMIRPSALLDLTNEAIKSESLSKHSEALQYYTKIIEEKN
mmetsp:Transcript_13811/g.17377  ORF Transcript_13811/g.17377 Transcript_13811/m.17377 type:complete len:82 (+) Transcript_13811:46-291(+)